MKIIIIIFGILVLFSCKNKNINILQQNSIDTFPVIKPIIKDTFYTHEYAALIESIQNIEIRALINGIIDSILVDEGKHVSKGQLLFSLNNQGLYEEILKKEAFKKSIEYELKQIELELENSKILTDKKIISISEFEMLKSKKEMILAKIKEADAEISLSKTMLNYTKIKAPFSGIINRILKKEGSLMNQGDLLTTLSNNSYVYVYFNVSENDYLKFINKKENYNNREVYLKIADESLFPYKGVIETIESEFDRSTGNIAFRAKFQNPEKILKHGASGKILVNEFIKNATIIPQRSTIRIQEFYYVYVISKDNKVVLRKIKPIVKLEKDFIIKDDILKNEYIIYEGLQNLREGDKVNYKIVDY